MVLAVLMVGVMTGCEDLDDNGVDFVNESSVRVTVTPNGQTSWVQFVLDPGQDRNIDIDRDVYFLYSPANSVRADTSDEGEVIFYDR